MLKSLTSFFSIFCVIFFTQIACAMTDPLPSWNNGKVKQSIIEFVETITDKNSKDYVPPQDRIATFDNDGTLWVEQPLYPQMVFMKERAREISDKKPEIYKNKESVRNKNDEMYAVTSSEINIDDYTQIVQQWLQTANHPRFKKHCTDLIYQPMLEVMNYLRNNQFKVYIVSGGGQDFIRSFAPNVYGVASNEVVGSTSQSEFIDENNKLSMIKTRKLLLICDKAGKPEAIHLFIGKKPLMAFGNSDGDKQMLEWTESGSGKRLMVLVHHDDAKREYAYDSSSKIGTFSTALMREAENNHWQVISMKNDWKVIFPFELS